MITWAEKVAWVGMVVTKVKPKQSIATWKHRIRLRIPCGVCTHGDGDTIEEAIESAAGGMNIDWDGLEERMTEHEWQKMSHT